ncbi:FAD-dependent oxidoreductase [Microtetraspora niveoalba]|uniref:FAD-dependent oxidoreductase n=1 Tax=Microtetraspora niveoalba TaxID=46175 RepID=UPI0008356A5A|nr:FAD-dependent oxidoreductase [Microtetraspora niveoalba]
MAWDHEYDVVVVGSGAGGLTAALTARLHGLSALVIEKTGRFGGSTALSGGAIWVPNNLYLEQAGERDTVENARAYLDATVGDRVPAVRKDAYLRRGPEMLRFLHDRTRWVRFEYTPGYSDYYPEYPGGRSQGRSVEPSIVDGRLLGPEFARMRRAGLPTYGMTMTSADFGKINMMTRTWVGKRTSMKVAMRGVKALLTGQRLLSLGEALVARLRLALAEAGGELWLSTPFRDLVVEDGRVTGVRALREGREIAIRARHGVVFAAGGFSHDQSLREKYLPSPTSTEWTHAAEGQTGDTLRAGLEAGAAVDLMDKVWGAPSVPRPDGTLFFLVNDRAIPSMIIVDGDGERYVRESLPYHEFVDKMYEHGEPATNSWMIIDSRTRSRYIFVGLFPGQPFPRSWRESGLLKSGRTPGELAERIGVPRERLEATFERFNRFARAGKDEDFGRGDSAYDNYYGDPTLPNPNLAPLEKGPFYALPVLPGDIGTKGGLVTDADARVLREDGTAIEGLYATGNCSAAVTGETYPGPGATIGPAMTFGYVAATHMAGRETTPTRGDK